MRAIALVLILSTAQEAHAQCFRRSCFAQSYVAPYVAPVVTPVVATYPSYDNSLNVSFTITFPPTAVSGATQYNYTPAGYFAFDSLEAFKSRMAYSSRALDVAQAGNDSATLIVQAAGASEERAYKLAFADKLATLLASTPAPGTTYQFSASRDGYGKLRLSDPLASGPTYGTPTPAGATPADLPAGNPGEALGAANIFKAQCVTCHGAGRTEAGLDLSDLSKLTPAIGLKILDRVTTMDPSKRMPKGGSLSGRQIFSLHQEYFQSTQQPAAGAKEATPAVKP